MKICAQKGTKKTFNRIKKLKYRNSRDGMISVISDWAIFERSWQQIVSQKWPTYIFGEF